MKLKNFSAALLATAMLLTGCAGNETGLSEHAESSSREAKSTAEGNSSSASKPEDAPQTLELTVEGGVLKEVSEEAIDVVVPTGVTEIGNAFVNCTKLASVSLPDSVTHINEGAFKDCTNVSVTYKGQKYGYNQLADLYEAINTGNLPKEPLDEQTTLNELDFLYYAYYDCISCAKSNKSFDITKSINDVEEFDRLLDYVLIADDNPDKVELDEGPLLTFEYDYYNFEKTEKLIQKSILPTFEISSVDYKKSQYWSEEDNCFVWSPQISDGGLMEAYTSFFIQEDGYKQGDYIYVTAVFIDENHGTSANLKQTPFPSASKINLSDITPEYFDLPRCQMKFKKLTIKDFDRYEPYFLVGFKPTDERPAGLDFAKKFYSEIKSLDTPHDDGSRLVDFGLLDTKLGKRAYIYSFSELGLRDYMSDTHYVTYGARGENDKIEFNKHYSSETHWSNDDITNIWDCLSTETSIIDSFNGDAFKYSYANIGHEDGTYEETAEYTHNDQPVSERDFYSAELVDDFKDYFKSESYAPPGEKLQADTQTLAGLYEIARAVTE